MLTEDQIQFLNRVCSGKWTEKKGAINVSASIHIHNMNLTEIPIPFRRVLGKFNCSSNQLTSLLNGPTYVSNHYYCSYNLLTNLIGAPSIIRDSFSCGSNQLTSLEGGPKEVVGFYSCSNNKLTNLIGAPEICNSSFYCEHNQLTSLEGCPSFIKYNLYCQNNPNLKYLWGIGRVEGGVYYDNQNEINEWIIELAKKDIFFPHYTLQENTNWISREQKYSILLGAPEEIRQLFSPRILHLVDSGVYNESRILDYKKFSRLC